MESFKLNCIDIWKSNFDRKDINNEFKPIHVKYIGVLNINEYNNILKTYVDKFTSNSNISVYFDSQIPFQAEFDLINYIMKELETMDTEHLENADIDLMKTKEINDLFLNALGYVVRLAKRQESFLNNNMLYNFITKQIVWSYLYIKNLEYHKNRTNKCLYYGNISKHEIYFLLLLAKMNFDVIYINPLKHENWEVDSDKIFETKTSQQIIPVDTLKTKIAQASTINVEESLALKLERELENELYLNTGVFKPWQLRNYDPVSLYLKSTIIDLKNNWNEPARVRQGFVVKNNKVYIPNFFQQIDGIYPNINEYKEIVENCINTKNTLFIKTDGAEWVHINNDPSKYQLTFTQLNDGRFDIEQVKTLPIYTLKNFKIELQNLILNKMNECILDKNLFASPFTKNEVLDFVMMILNLDINIIKLIDGFDFAQKVPKVVIYMNTPQLDHNFILLLAFLQKMSFDIVIFNPTGLFDIRSVINSNTVDSIRLEEINYDLTYEKLMSQKKKFSFFSNKRR